MANTQYFSRTAGFYYTPSSGTTWETYPIPTQLLEPRPAYRVRQYVAESLDYSAREVFNVTGPNSTGYYEFVGTIRFADDSTDTIRFLRSCALGNWMSYTTALTTGTTAGAPGMGAEVLMLEPSPERIDVLMDRARGSGSYENLEIAVRFRLTNGAGTTARTIFGLLSSGDFSTASGASWF